jgi:hypothetical protein
LGEEGGVRVWRRRVQGSALLAFKGEAVIDSPIEKVAAVLDDTTRRKEWVHSIAEAVRIEESANRLKRLEYNRTSVPWPLRDRDFVFEATVSMRRPGKNPQPGEAKQLYVRMQSVEHRDYALRDCCVRGQIHESSYLLTDLGGAKTRAQVLINVDSKGAIPAWVANLFQKKWPARTLAGISRQAKKADLRESALLSAYFREGKLPAGLSEKELLENFEQFPME